MKCTFLHSIAALVGSLLAGCSCGFETRADSAAAGSGGEARPDAGASGRETVRIRIQDPDTHEGVQTMPPDCDRQAAEAFNGRDDNCNGQIDEGFVGTGAIQITLWWDTNADVDLYVIDPRGNEISYQNRESPTGGTLDRDARGACQGERQTTENVFWAGAPPSGQYQVLVDYFEACGAGMTPVVLSISVGGQVVGSYQYPLGPTDRRLTMATFQIP